MQIKTILYNNNNIFYLLKILHSTADVQVLHRTIPLHPAVTVSIAEYLATIFFRSIHSFVLLLIELDILK